MKFAIILDNKLVNKYESNKKESFGGAWGSERAIHVEIPEAIALEHAQWDGEKIIEVLPPPLSVGELREKEYLALGITEKKMIVDLWEMVVENRPEAALATQAKRITVKNKHPKKKD